LNVLGLVVEYNPFHNGHLHHLNASKSLVNSDYVVAVMSGNFVQRGEPAIIDKFSRTEIALKMGIDIVFELPFVYAIQDASGFANGAIGVLERTGVVSDLVFGSESADIEGLSQISDILINQPKEYKKTLNRYLKEGLSFPNARKYALNDYFTQISEEKEIIEKLEKSNDILGLEYLNALKLYDSKIKPQTIKRIGVNYNEEQYTGEISSATAIRKIIEDENIEKVKDALPDVSFNILKREIALKKGPVFLEDMRDMILSKLRMMNRNELSKIDGVKEGLDRRFLDCSKVSSTVNQLLMCVKTKRFTLTRIRRTLLKIFFDLTESEVQLYNKYGPQYLRVLGFSKKGQTLLGQIKKVSKYPIITTPSRYKRIYHKLSDESLSSNKKFNSIPEIFLKQIEYDFLASNVYSLLYKDKKYAINEPDMVTKVFIQEN
jgi:predicted nucleotidyltransferase